MWRENERHELGMAYMCRKGPRPCLSFITATPCVMFDPLAFSEATDVLGGQAARHSSTFGNPSKIATCRIRLYGLSRNNLFTQRAVIPRADQARQYTPLAASSNGISRPSQGKHARPEGLLRRPLFQSERGVIMKRLDQPSMPARKQIRTPIHVFESGPLPRCTRCFEYFHLSSRHRPRYRQRRMCALVPASSRDAMSMLSLSRSLGAAP